MRLVYIGFAFSHHINTHAGYHQIKNYVNYDYIIDCQNYFTKKNSKVNFIQRIVRKLHYLIFNDWPFPFYILKCIWLGLLHNDLVFHFIYGENLYKNIKPFIRKGNKIVVTYHQPFEWFEKNPKHLKTIHSIDRIILMSDKEINKFKQFAPDSIIKFIPHGVDCNFYKINKNIIKKKMILTVGNWLRDYEFANTVYKDFIKKHKDWEIKIITNKNNHIHIEKNSQITIESNISDELLKQYYQQCSILFLPLIRYTANNALLEAGSCGCNIIIASNFLDNSYISNELIKTCSLKKEEAINLIGI